MSFRRVASSQVYLASGKRYNNHVVETYDGRMVNHYDLYEELPMTEWLGGVIVETTIDEHILQEHKPSNINDFFTATTEESETTIVIHITNVDLETGALTDSSVITIL